jgi:hypothetical protein
VLVVHAKLGTAMDFKHIKFFKTVFIQKQIDAFAGAKTATLVAFFLAFNSPRLQGELT